MCIRDRLPAKITRLNGVNVSVEVVPVMRQSACIGAFALLQRFNDVEARQSQLRNQLLHKGYRAKYEMCIRDSLSGTRRPEPALRYRHSLPKHPSHK